MKGSPYGARGAVLILVKASVKAKIPVLDVKAMAENSSRLELWESLGLGLERYHWMAEMVCGVDSTMTVGHQRGHHPFRLMRRVSLPA